MLSLGKKYICNLSIKSLQFKADLLEASVKALLSLGLQRIGWVQNLGPFFLGFHILGTPSLSQSRPDSIEI